MRFGAHDPAGARLSAASASAPASPPALALACAGSGRALLHKLRRVIDQKRVKVQAVRQDEVADVAPPNRHRVEADRVFALERHLDLLQVRVHGDVDTGDSAVADGAVLELDGHRLVGQLHQKPHQLPG
eukprot:CAMPEP_0118820774 /NCGR_PEP_ID=MMETSP1162-20130426/7963_1 /TAXON_ID=33656 /ORGANISM="Phaeocystis Sp, Strain CCMP2710" /LENGTH=128 /DNA_ID=CAMNT_0006751195 /DNA_START=1 /DNA_END=387 /DNA_ORIENTATION=-